MKTISHHGEHAPLPRVLVAAGLIRGAEESEYKDYILMSKRLADVHLANAWEFPGGKIELGEDPVEALRRELREELNIEISNPQIYAIGHHCYDSKEVILMVYECFYESGDIQALGVAEFTWLTAKEVCALPLPPADIEVVERLRRDL